MSKMFPIKDTINQELKKIFLNKALLDWNSSASSFIPGPDGGKRGYLNVQDNFTKDIVNLCDNEIKKLVTELGLGDGEYAYCRHFIGVNTPGAWVTPHTDVIQFLNSSFPLNIKKFSEIRFNFFLQYPESGGNPVLLDKELKLQKGYGWYFNASIPHSSTPVEGNMNRIVISFGSVIENNRCEQLGLI